MGIPLCLHKANMELYPGDEIRGLDGFKGKIVGTGPEKFVGYGLIVIDGEYQYGNGLRKLAKHFDTFHSIDPGHMIVDKHHVGLFAKEQGKAFLYISCGQGPPSLRFA